MAAPQPNAIVHLLVVVILSGVLFSGSNVEAKTTKDEIVALEAVKGALRPLTLFASWKGDPCDGAWMGVTCDDNKPQHVVGLKLASLGVTGSISTAIGALTALQWLNLEKNSISGPLPKEVGALGSLLHLELESNRISGPVPKSIKNLNLLTHVDISKNLFTGTAPVFSPTAPLQYLSYSINDFVGPFPESTLSHSSLRLLSIGANGFFGPLPTDFSSLQFLTRLVLGQNDFSGPLPDSLGHLPRIRALDISNNNFSGPIPASYSNIRRLKIKGNKYLVLAPASASAPAPSAEAPASASASAPDSASASAPASASASAPASESAPAPASSSSFSPSSLPAPKSKRAPHSKPAPKSKRAPTSRPLPKHSPPKPSYPPPSKPTPKPSPSKPSPKAPASAPASAPGSAPGAVRVCDTCTPTQLAWSSSADGGGSCLCVYPLRFALRMSMNYSNFDEHAQTDLEMQLANIFAVNKGQVRLLAAQPGSVIASMALGPDSPATTLQPGTVERVTAILKGTSNTQLSLVGFGFIEVLTVEAPAEMLRPPPTQAPGPDGSLGNMESGSPWGTGAIIGVTVGAVAVVALLVLIIVLWRCLPKRKRVSSASPANATKAAAVAAAAAAASNKKKEAARQQLQSWSAGTPSRGPGGSTPLHVPAGSKSPSTRRVPGVVVLSLPELQMATDTFAAERSIGSDPLGTTFIGTLPSGQEIAVKRVEPSVVEGQSDDDFMAVAATMARLKHPNVVQLQGYCIDYGERILVFEHYPNGSLFDHLHHRNHDATKDHGQKLTWQTRIEIAVATARALVYLHEECVPSIIHRNISSRNILLDKRLRARVAGAGLSFLNPVGADEKSMSDQLVGGFAYNAPEYAMSGIYTAKSDVYSYGVVLLELLTGRKPVDPSKPKPESSLVRWAAPLLHDVAELEAILDQKICGPLPDTAKLTTYAEIITRCIQPEPEFRPTMSKIVNDLTRKVLQPSGSRKNGGLPPPSAGALVPTGPGSSAASDTSSMRM
uniref:Receptor-like kinase n=1 Tax=Closterium ehrenbergii TaxID=102165 RepID=A7VM48_CLOEH|nr:receptor-like kinase [Closterium ehrenbergii]